MELKSGYKETEVGVIPEEWEVRPLNRISPRQSVGLVINPSSYFDKAGTVPLLVGSNVGENFIDSTNSSRITKSSNELLSASRLVSGDLVTVRVGEPGVTAVVPPELDSCNCASMMIVRRHPSFDSHWLCAVMNSRLGRQQVEHVQYGTAQKQFNISDAVDFCYPVPPLPEQRAIAGALSDVDELIGSLDQLIAKKRDLKQAAMQQLLTGQTRLPCFRGEWEVNQLGDVLNVRHGKSQSDVVASNGKYPILATGGEIGRTNYYLYDKPSVLIGRKGTIDAPQFVETPFWTIDTLFFTEISSDVSAKFIFYKFNTINWQSYNEASGVPSLNASTIESIEVKLPKHDEQCAIAAVLSDMDAEITTLEQRRDKTLALKQGMMQELLTGRTRLA